MAWTTTLTEQLRYYLNDADTVTYSDARLSKFIAFAATEVLPKLNLTTSYSVNISVPSIDPDPSNDPNLAPLLVLKAAVIIIRNEIKQLSITAGYAIKDDRSSINGAEALKALKDLLNKFEENFEDALKDFLTGSGGIGRAILSPYTSHS